MLTKMEKRKTRRETATESTRLTTRDGGGGRGAYVVRTSGVRLAGQNRIQFSNDLPHWPVTTLH